MPDLTDTVLVTGGTGLVGKALQYVIEHEPEGSRFGKKPGENWVFLGSKDADLKDFAATKAVFDKYRPAYVIHLAAVVGGLFSNMKANSTFLRSNIIINDNVLESAHQLGCKKVVSCLSTCVFPDKVEYPLTEDKVHLGPPHPSNFGYSHAKRLVDVQNQAYHVQYGDNFTSVIPTNIFGEWDNYDLEESHVIPGLVHKCLLAKKNGTPFTVFGTGKPLRQFIYSRDLAKLIIWVLRSYDEIDPVILSPAENEEISIKQVADAIVKAVGFEGDYKFDASKSDGQYRKPASNSKLLSKIGEWEFTPFDTALQQSVEWFVDNYAIARTSKHG